MLPENAAQARAHASHLLTCIVYMCLIGLSTHLQCTIRRINQSYGMSKLSNTFACTSFGVRTSCERGTCGIYLVFCLRVETLLHTEMVKAIVGTVISHLSAHESVMMYQIYTRSCACCVLCCRRPSCCCPTPSASTVVAWCCQSWWSHVAPMTSQT